MTKMEFILKIRSGLASLPQEDIQRSVDYYREMVDDRIEDGLTEEEAVAAVGSPDEIIRQILAESAQNPKPQQPKTEQPQKKSNSGMSALAILLIIIGSPIWLPLLIAAVSVLISMIVTVFAVLIALYATVIGLGICAIVLLALAVTNPFTKGVLYVGMALILAGLTILSFFAVNFIAKFIFFLCKKLCQGIKFIFTRRTLNENR